MEAWREELYHAMHEDALMHYGVKGMEWGKRKAVKTSGKTNAEWAASRIKQNSFDPYKTKAQPYDPNNPVFFNKDNPREGERQEKLRVELERLNAKRRALSMLGYEKHKDEIDRLTERAKNVSIMLYGNTGGVDLVFKKR